MMPLQQGAIVVAKDGVERPRVACRNGRCEARHLHQDVTQRQLRAVAARGVVSVRWADAVTGPISFRFDLDKAPWASIPRRCARLAWLTWEHDTLDAMSEPRP